MSDFFDCRKRFTRSAPDFFGAAVLFLYAAQFFARLCVYYMRRCDGQTGSQQPGARDRARRRFRRGKTVRADESALTVFCRALLRGFSEREDVVQAVFLKVIQKSPSLVFFTDCFAWMFRVAKNECFDRARKRRLLPAEGPREEEDHFDLRFALSKLDAKRRQMVETQILCGVFAKRDRLRAAFGGIGGIARTCGGAERSAEVAG